MHFVQCMLGPAWITPVALIVLVSLPKHHVLPARITIRYARHHHPSLPHRTDLTKSVLWFTRCAKQPIRTSTCYLFHIMLIYYTNYNNIEISHAVLRLL
ncbi:MAG TPA: hypothetical protein DCW33_01055 [Proteobacteria bacterium]|nr:hypothetical protein [Pseudomonadota bacterium]